MLSPWTATITGVALPPEIIAAAQKYGPSVNAIAKQYGISGSALLAKLIQGESGGRGDRTSTAGAKGYTQFMPGSRKVAMDKFGVDPWADPDQAVHAAALHLQGKINGSKGLAGYNPGSPTYTSYILGQKVGNVASGARPSQGSSATPAASASGSVAPVETGPPQITDGGQASDFTSLLGQLLRQPAQQQQAAAPIAPPSFSAAPAMPQGFSPLTPTAAPAPEQDDGVGTALGLLETLQGSAPKVGASGGPEGAEGVSAAPITERVTGARTNIAGQTGGVGADRALSWAKSKLGFKETGPNSGGIASYANQRFGMSNQAWCAMFTSLAVTKGGAPASARTPSVATVRSRAQEGEGYQRGFVDPGRAQPGDLILFGNDHIGMVDHISDGQIHYVGGNQSDGVTMASVPVGRGDIVRPKYGARRK